ncbi:hypothetical protein HR10_01605 [Porphyromonas gulae]|nr:hypothetical protein HR10_01605 [Porphyromonas gulae]
MQEIRGSTDVFVFEPRLEGKDVLLWWSVRSAALRQRDSMQTDRASEGCDKPLLMERTDVPRKNV